MTPTALGSTSVALAAALLAGVIQTPKVILRGTVVDSGTGRPVAGAQVHLRGAGGSDLLASTTDRTGQFRLAADPGRYRLRVTKSGYLEGAFGQQSPSDSAQTIILDSAKTLRVALWRPAIVSGRITDEAGEPVVSAEVRALRKVFRGGRPFLATVAIERSDDRGEYRLANLVPGEYAIAVPTSSARRGGPVVFYPTTYHPGVLSAASAVQVRATSAAEITGMDVTVRTDLEAELTGTVLGEGRCSATIELRDQSPGIETDLPVPRTKCDTDGSFVFAGLAPGAYNVRIVQFPIQRPELLPSGTVLVAQSAGGFVTIGGQLGTAALAPLQSRTTLWAEMPVIVEPRRPGEGPRPRVTLRLNRGTTIAGRVVFQGAATPPSGPALSGVGFSVREADGPHLDGIPLARIESDESFETVELPPGRYVLSPVGGWSGWYLKSIQILGMEYAGSAIDLSSLSAAAARNVLFTFVDRASPVTGRVLSSSGEAVPDSMVHYFSTDPRSWVGHGGLPIRFGRTRPDETGEFHIESLVPGEYCLVATRLGSAQAVPWEWGDPEFFRALMPSCSRLTVNEGQGVRRELTIRQNPRRSSEGGRR